ncbi:Flp pilus assembly protein CpaB [Limobrevibacterium gyesilva]|uniref:Flp pilus assembly protein CpaB n=1 Tax=Limobrevibacterium gyesilva TaxID=2991712 RepID=A0AA41YPF6_9PROT|nr:Flp pilus assembly protein CpaB [Limobrevibacterium gyesilva]MCW3475828.1 Flp pilus assembly protein CpaB [Limobrevibacterium gyesilva]
MALRIVVFVMMSLGLLGFGTVAWISMQPPPAEASVGPGGAPVTPQDNVLVAARDVAAGALLKPDDLGTVQMPRPKIPEGASVDTPAARQQLIGSMVRRRLAANESLLPRDLLRPGDHGFLAAVLGAGMRAVTIGVDAITGTAGLIWPGDRVDVMLTHQIDDPERPASRRVAAETVLSNVRVIAIDQQLVQGAAPGSTEAKPAATVTLEVTSVQSERVSVATRLGRLSLVVRAARPGEDERVADATPGITWAGDVSPALSADAVPKPAPSVVKVYRGSGDGQEYHF